MLEDPQLLRAQGLGSSLPVSVEEELNWRG